MTLSPSTEQSILQTQHRFWAALQHKSRAEFEEILAPDFVSRSPVQANENQIEEHTSELQSL